MTVRVNVVNRALGHGRGTSTNSSRGSSPTIRPGKTATVLKQEENGAWRWDDDETSVAEVKDQGIQTTQKQMSNWATQTYADDWTGRRGLVERFVTPRPYVETCLHDRETGSYFLKNPRVKELLDLTEEQALMRKHGYVVRPQ